MFTGTVTVVNKNFIQNKSKNFTISNSLTISISTNYHSGETYSYVWGGSKTININPKNISGISYRGDGWFDEWTAVSFNGWSTYQYASNSKTLSSNEVNTVKNLITNNSLHIRVGAIDYFGSEAHAQGVVYITFTYN
ncbi:hypothetical protein [Succinivibrio sp.]|uniref:hypothetical protein n=1 Tax=Succinivibrio sp. TaxID=2053619 RepID=UPI0025FEAB9E|nr:hypothetical protein [Succinivibrio sp.]MBQ9220442.1 hypothetical protein [Succinivibrio sp.]